MGGDYGCYDEDGLDGIRQKYPMMKGVDGVDALIPFSSDIKFNLLIRDMNPEVARATKEEDNCCVFMKGAPERVLSRCSTVLVDGNIIPKNQHADQEIDSANTRFGGNGERVLAFARKFLDPKIFVKDSGYAFDVKKWKAWKEVREFDQAILGWFPMFNLTLVGLVSLNDPPRPRVDTSVLKCKAAGIKVIMVTGD